ncbi:hypothetical protein LINGRAHAP2_LOCUS3953 [Linum grandiflorum]
MNTDAGFSSQGIIGLGCIICDWNGNVFLVATKFEVVKWPVDVAEGRAILFGIQKALDKRIEPLVIEFDCKRIVESIKKNENYIFELGSILADIYELETKCDTFGC